jgi:amidohydrolase
MEIPTTPFHDWLVDLRRYFHQHPELSYGERKTAAKIAETLDQLGVSCQTGVGQTGVVARLEAKAPGPTLLFRADMDGLPLEEANDVVYRSKHPGRMHACGHDGHVTIALGIIRRLMDTGWVDKGSGRIFFFFQPAEEGGAGAKAMLEAGVLEGEEVNAVFAGHLHPELPVGHIGISPGVSNAASDSLDIRIKGRGGHGAQPHRCRDPIVAAAHLVTQLQSIVSRNVSPLESVVLTIGQFHAGTASNIIPQQAVLNGTLRTLSVETRRIVVNRLEEMIRGLETAFDCSATLTVTEGYPLVINHPELVQWAMSRSQDLLGKGGIHREPPRMGSEDFAYFLERYPGVLIRVGCHDPEKGFTYGLHSPHFDFDERTLDVGVRLFTHLLTTYSNAEESRVASHGS